MSRSTENIAEIRRNALRIIERARHIMSLPLGPDLTERDVSDMVAHRHMAIACLGSLDRMEARIERDRGAGATR
jgi:hypothetical protein